MTTVTIIPSRLNSERLPQKPLADIDGLPMIVRVFKQAEKANIGPVIVACCGHEIKEIVESHGGKAILTDPGLPSGTDRVYAALQEFDNKGKYGHIINLQGDLPLVNPEHLRLMVKYMEASPYQMMTLAAPIADTREITNMNVVKIAMAQVDEGQKTHAYYFSRAAIPSEAPVFYHHIGIYGFTRQDLRHFVSLKPSYLEKAERLEQLRALENGITIDVVTVDAPPQSVDTQEDLEKVRNLVMKYP